MANQPVREKPIPRCDPESSLTDSLAALASWLLDTSPDLRTGIVFRDSLIDCLARLSHQAEENYERISPATGETPTAAQGLALAQLLRSRLRAPSDYATVSLGGVISLPDGYVAVRFSDRFEAGIDRDGATSS
jgi:hypothetical protein